MKSFDVQKINLLKTYSNHNGSFESVQPLRRSLLFVTKYKYEKCAFKNFRTNYFSLLLLYLKHCFQSGDIVNGLQTCICVIFITTEMQSRCHKH